MPSTSAAAIALLLCLAVVPALADDDPVVARVDGEEIRRSEVEQSVDDLPEQYRQMPLEVLFDMLRDRAIDTTLLSEEAARRDLAEDEAVQEAMVRAEELILRNRLIETTVEAAITDEALEEAYTAKQAEPSFTHDEVKARHILVATEAEAQELIAELEAGGDFETLAREHSTGPSGPDGGDLGYFRREQMVGPFADAAFAMAPGEVSAEPIETQFGWHVILVEDRQSVTPSFEDTRAELEQELGRDAVTALLESLRDEASIERFDPEGQPVPPSE